MGRGGGEIFIEVSISLSSQEVDQKVIYFEAILIEVTGVGKIGRGRPTVAWQMSGGRFRNNRNRPCKRNKNL